MLYRQLRCGVDDRNYKLVPSTEVLKNIKDKNKEWFTSVYEYNEDHYQRFLSTGSIAGIKDVVTPRLVWDFDSHTELEKAQQDTQALVGRLSTHIAPECIQVAFSGNKGFSVEIETDAFLNVDQFKTITKALAGDLETYDPRINDPARIWRVIGTKHKSGLFKTPITLDQLNNWTISQIKEEAVFYNPGKNVVKTTPLPNHFLNLKTLEPKKPIVKEALELKDLDWTIKPKYLTNCRWALQNGFFNEGGRNSAFLCLAATYKNQGDDKEICYRRLKGVAELQSRRNDCDRYSDEELYNNIVQQVYGPHWNNGQFTCRDENNWLHGYCGTLGDHHCNKAQSADTVGTDGIFHLFKSYAEKFEQNVLETGIHDLDEKTRLMVGTSNGILAPPGVGKSSFALQILQHNSDKDIPCMLFSYDMFHSALYMRMLQRESGLHQSQLYNMFKEEPEQANELREHLNGKYKNVQFCFKSGQTIDELDQTIVDVQEKTGKKLKLVVVDYNELVETNLSDSTASSAVVAQRLRQIANDREVCIVTLLQPSKNFSSPGDEIVNYNAAKGSSSIVQSLTLLLGFSRPGFNPLNPETDKFFNITCLKNRNGPLFSVDLRWEGLKGEISSLTDEDFIELKEIRERKKMEKNAKGESWD